MHSFFIFHFSFLLLWVLVAEQAFLQVWQRGVLCSLSVWASHGCGFSCGARALGLMGSVAVVPGTQLACSVVSDSLQHFGLQSTSLLCGIFQAEFFLLSHRGSLLGLQSTSSAVVVQGLSCSEAQAFFFHILFHYGLSQEIEYSSLCYTVGTCFLSILCIMVCIC